MQLEKNCQVNIQIFGEYTDTFDDLYGAIFKGTLKLALIGKVTRSWLRHQDTFEIDAMGVYMRDTYDFNAEWSADQIYGLGIWSKQRLLKKHELLQYRSAIPQINAINFPGFVPVKNADFSRW
ncbi:MAG: hypothetical protein EON54_24945, partial [Alcaligenaceae bacterium]